MEFCPACGTRLTLTKRKAGQKTIFLLSCPKCGYERKAAKAMVISPKVIERHRKDGIIVIGKEAKKLRTLPTVRVECPRCGNNLAYVWQVQTRRSEESSTQFFRCTKCGHTFREYS
ncbi:MAG: transcription factor S [Candidatus Bathyarchaeia archaeon]